MYYVRKVSLRLYQVKPFQMYSVERSRERNEFSQFMKTVRLHVSKVNRPVDLEGSSRISISFCRCPRNHAIFPSCSRPDILHVFQFRHNVLAHMQNHAFPVKFCAMPFCLVTCSVLADPCCISLNVRVCVRSWFLTSCIWFLNLCRSNTVFRYLLYITVNVCMCVCVCVCV